MYSSLCLCLCEHLAKDISHSAIYRSSETFPFHLKGFVIQRLLHACVCVCVRVCVCVQIHSTKRTRDLKRASNCSEMSQKGGLARGYKPVVGVRAFLAEDQTEGSTTAKSGAVFFPHFAFPLSLSLLLCNNCCTCSHFWGKKISVLIIEQQPERGRKHKIKRKRKTQNKSDNDCSAHMDRTCVVTIEKWKV